jgi:hypothetical protein
MIQVNTVSDLPSQNDKSRTGKSSTILTKNLNDQEGKKMLVQNREA